MKKRFFLRNVVLAGILVLAPLALSAKGASKIDETINNCTMPDGTVCDLNLFKTEGKFTDDKKANLSNMSNYKQLYVLTKEEKLAWKESKTPVETDVYFLKQYSAGETDLLETMKKKKTPFASSFSTDGDRIRIIYILANKTYKTLSYEKLYMVERSEDEKSGYTVNAVRLPDGTVTDLIMFTSTAEYKESSSGWLAKGVHGGRWSMETLLKPKEFKKIYDPEGSISVPGYIARHYSQANLGEIGKIMKEKHFAVAAFPKEINTKKRQIILIEAVNSSYDLFLYRKMDYVLEGADVKADGWECEFSSYITKQEYVDVPYREWDPGQEAVAGSAGQGVQAVEGTPGHSVQRYRRELRDVRYDYPTQFYLYKDGKCVYEGTASVIVTNLDWGKSYQVKWYSPSSQQWESSLISNDTNQSKVYINLY